jgi:hypothetical protein
MQHPFVTVCAMQDRSKPSNRPQHPNLFGLRPPGRGRSIESPLRRALHDDSWTGTAVERLATRVGGIDALEALTTERLIDLEFDWSVARASDRDAVAAILDAAEACLAGERNLIGASLGLPPLIDD